MQYKIYENLPNHAAIAGEEGEALSMYSAFKMMVEANMSNVAMVYNALEASIHSRMAPEAAVDMLMPINILLVHEVSRQATAEARVRGRWFYIISPSFQLKLARKIRAAFPDVVGREIRESDMNGAYPGN